MNPIEVTYSQKNIRGILLTFGLTAVYAVLLCPFIIATPKSGLSYAIARTIQLLSILVWLMLHIKMRHSFKRESWPFVCSIHLWWIVLIVLTFLYVPQKHFSLINFWLVTWNIILLTNLHKYFCYDRLLSALNILLSGLIYLSAILFILYPSGLWQENDWAGFGDNTRHLFGNYNQTGIVALMALLVSGNYTMQTGRGRTNMFLLTLTSIAMVIAMGSMTSTMGLIIIIAYFYLRRFIRHPFAWISVFVCLYITFFFLVVWNGISIDKWPAIAQFVENVLGKDLTFTARVYLWKDSVELIQAHPLTGYGVQGVEWMADHIHGSGPHNIWLMMLLEGGIILCSLFIIITTSVFAAAYKRHNSQSAYATICVCAMLLMSLFETYHFICLFTILIIAYYTCITMPDRCLQTTSTTERKTKES